MTALYQIEQSSPSSTSPMTAAFSAMKIRAPNRGCFPSYARVIMGREISTITMSVMARRIAFRYRAHEVTRLEAFSDVIFGFALSLIVVSLEAPKTYGELMETMRGILPFGFCFLIFIGLWLQHHEFFRRYALQDKTTVVLNIALLFVILFYVYPLKFMFVLMARGILGEPVRHLCGTGTLACAAQTGVSVPQDSGLSACSRSVSPTPRFNSPDWFTFCW
jgi:hypothetical protein